MTETTAAVEETARAWRDLLSRLDVALGQRMFGAAETELDKAIAEYGEQPELLWRQAALRDARGRPADAMAAFAAAVMGDVPDPSIVDRYCRFLEEQGMQRKALELLDGLPADVAQHPLLREDRARIYAAAGWWALAFDAVGSSEGLTAEGRRGRQQCWLMSGGPFGLVRNWIRGFDKQVRSRWNYYAEASMPGLATVDLPDAFTADRASGEVDALLVPWAMLGAKAERAQRLVDHWLTRYLLLPLLAWVTVFAAVTGPTGSRAVAAAEATGIALILRLPLMWLIRRQPASALRETMRAIAGLAALVGGGAAIVAATPTLLSGYEVVGTGMIATAGLVSGYGIAWNVPWVIGLRRLRWLMRNHLRAALLERLGELLTQIALPAAQSDLSRRDYWIGLLESAARQIEHDLPQAVPSRDPQTAQWVQTRAVGAATALRLMKRHIVAPIPGSWDRLAAGLRRDAMALATGDLGLLRWTEPPTPAARRRSLLRNVLAVAQKVVVAAAPVVLVFALQPVLKLSGSTLDWWRGGTIFWAVFYLAISIDPTLVDKVQQAQSVFGAIKSIGGPKSPG